MCRARFNALLLARSHIADGRENFICYALRRVGAFRTDLKPATHDLRIEIEASLEGCRTLSSWLALQICQSGAGVECPSSAFDAYMQLARLAWLDKLIEQERK